MILTYPTRASAPRQLCLSLVYGLGLRDSEVRAGVVNLNPKPLTCRVRGKGLGFGATFLGWNLRLKVKGSQCGLRAHNFVESPTCIRERP